MMTTEQAKQILLTYRPWADDATDPELAEALALCRTDPELAQWFTAHCAAQTAVRARLQGIKVPEGLAQQIVSERRAQLAGRTQARRRLVVMLACVAIILSGWFIWQHTLGSPEADMSFNGYRNRMTRTVARAYGMEVETNDVAVIRAHLAAGRAPVDYAVPTALVGCGVLRWQNQPVTMLCYQTGKPLPPGLKSDLILFVARQEDIRNSAALRNVEFAKVSDWFTASWAAGDKVYLLVGTDEAELRQRL
jgi:hypothetical protein